MRSRFTILSLVTIALVASLVPRGAASQEVAVPVAETAQPAVGLPIFATLGFGFGVRRDGCVLCESPEDNESFSAHLSVGRTLLEGIGVGLDASVWRRSRPGVPGPPDSTGAPTATSLSNMLGNTSVVFSYQWWHLYVRAGGGIAWGSQSLEEEAEEGAAVVAPWSGMGVGYTLGAGVTLPVYSLISMAFYANLNTGQYDMTRAAGGVVRDTEHRYVEIGVGLSLR